MTSIDDIFKKPLSSGNAKRKLTAEKNADEIYKSVKLNQNGHVRSNGQTTVEDEPEEDDDGYAGPGLPLDMEDEGADDEEGRFFGGGITSETADVLDYLEEQDKGNMAIEKIDSAWLRKLALNFERKISKNTELRAKFEGDPQRFMGSEADLDAEIKALSILSEHSELYREFAQLGCVSSLVSLLAHENTDISIDAIEIISELIDEDVDVEQAQWDAVVDAMLEANLLDLLAQNLSRFDEGNESDRNGVYHVLVVLESLASRSSIAESICRADLLLSQLLSRARKAESQVTQNKQYAAEVLAILLQSSSTNRVKFVEKDGIDQFLQLLSPYRKRDPAQGTDEEEFVENVFDCVICCVDDTPGKDKFLEAEGVELCLIMLKEGKMSRPRALRLLDHALGGLYGTSCCQKLVEAGGLKVLFTMFMKKHDKQTYEHLISIFASMFRLLPGDSAERIRLLGKFVEKDYEKIARLFQLRKDYKMKVGVVDREIATEKSTLSTNEQEENADEWLSRRLGAGLFSLQAIDVVLAWLVAEDDGAKSQIQKLMGEKFGEIWKTLKEQLDSAADEEADEAASLQDMLSTLIQFV
ncbi:MAG: hypothetical protein MMC33_000141 [Icmadophila ericetorum]|nr:hypothetical protein [Icmadophila ericetorum]